MAAELKLTARFFGLLIFGVILICGSFSENLKGGSHKKQKEACKMQAPKRAVVNAATNNTTKRARRKPVQGVPEESLVQQLRQQLDAANAKLQELQKEREHERAEKAAEESMKALAAIDEKAAKKIARVYLPRRKSSAA